MAAKRSTPIACYILKKSTPAVKDVTSAVDDDGGFNRMLRLMGIERTTVTLSEGEFLVPLSTSQASSSSATQQYRLRRDATITVSCPPSDVAGLNEEEVRYLERAEPSPEGRYILYSYPGFEKYLPSYTEPTPTQATSSQAAKKPYPQHSKELESHQEDSKPSRPSKSSSSFPFEIGSTVIVHTHKSSYYGVIKWLGMLPNVQDLMAGIELVSLS